MSDPTDSQLVERAREGDGAAFESLVHKHARLTFAAALSIVVNYADAQDVCQDTWIRALQKNDGCRHPDRFVFWMLQIARNQARDHLQYRKVRKADTIESAFGPEVAPDGKDPRAGLWRERQRRQLERAMAHLTPSQREVLRLHDLVGYTHGEIADSTGRSEVSSRQHLFQARKRMRALLGDPPRGAEA